MTNSPDNQPGRHAGSTRFVSPRIQLGASIMMTARELWATYVAIGVFIVATIGWFMLAFAMNLDVVEGSVAALRIFGLETTPDRGVQDPETGDWVQQALSLDTFVLGIQQFIFGAAYLLGTLLGLFAAAPLTAGFMEKGRIDLLLSKPLSRARLLAGHVLGVWLVVLLLSLYLVGSIWTVLGIKTGLWTPGFLWGIPIITVMFAVMYSVVLLVAVTTQSSALALIISYGLIFFSIILALHDQISPALGDTGAIIYGTLYHVLPNFIEVTGLMAQLAQSKPVNELYPLLSSTAFGAACYALAMMRFSRRDF